MTSRTLYTLNGETLPASEWARRIGITNDCLWERLSSKRWTLEEALTTPKVPLGKDRHGRFARQRFKLRLPPRIDTIPGGYDPTSKEGLGTGEGSRAAERPYYDDPIQSETLTSEAGR